jgi:hypothetical protein
MIDTNKTVFVKIPRKNKPIFAYKYTTYKLCQSFLNIIYKLNKQKILSENQFILMFIK